MHNKIGNLYCPKTLDNFNIKLKCLLTSPRSCCTNKRGGIPTDAHGTSEIVGIGFYFYNGDKVMIKDQNGDAKMVINKQSRTLFSKVTHSSLLLCPYEDSQPLLLSRKICRPLSARHLFFFSSSCMGGEYLVVKIATHHYNVLNGFEGVILL